MKLDYIMCSLGEIELREGDTFTLRDGAEGNFIGNELIKIENVRVSISDTGQPVFKFEIYLRKEIK